MFEFTLRKLMKTRLITFRDVQVAVHHHLHYPGNTMSNNHNQWYNSEHQPSNGHTEQLFPSAPGAPHATGQAVDAVHGAQRLFAVHPPGAATPSTHGDWSI